MKPYHPIQPKVFSAKPRQNKEGKKFKNFQIQKEFQSSNPISFEFSSKNNHRGLYMTTHNMFYFDLINDKVISNYPFKDTSLSCGHIRSDGKLVYYGSDEGSVRVYEPEKKINISSYDKSFKTKVNCISSNENKLIACSNDLTMKYFSLDNKSPITIFEKSFFDYILVNRFYNQQTILAGGMDKKLKLFDIRTGKPERSLQSTNNQPIADIRINSDGRIYICSDNQISEIDYVGFKEINKNTPIHSSIKKLILTDNRIFSISNSADSYVSVCNYDLKKLYNIKLGCEVIDFDITESLLKYSVVDENGKVNIKQKGLVNDKDQTEENEFDMLNPEKYASKTISKNYAYFNRGQYENLEFNKEDGSNTNLKVLHNEKTIKAKLQEYDIYMKKFMFKEALDSVLSQNNPEFILSLCEELIKRNSFHIALLNRSHKEILPLLKFISWKIDDDRYQSHILSIYKCFLDYYFFSFGVIDNKKIEDDEEKVIYEVSMINEKINKEIEMNMKMKDLKSKIHSVVLVRSIN